MMMKAQVILVCPLVQKVHHPANQEYIVQEKQERCQRTVFVSTRYQHTSTRVHNQSTSIQLTTAPEIKSAHSAIARSSTSVLDGDVEFDLRLAPAPLAVPVLDGLLLPLWTVELGKGV